jgi:signal transduction histidine kinase
MRRVRVGLRIALAVCLGAGATGTALAAELRPMSVAVLLSGSPDNPIELNFLTGLRNALRREKTEPLLPYGLNTSFLDLRRAGEDPERTKMLLERLARQYAGRHHDVLVVNGAPALKLALQNRQLWPGVPIVHASLQHSDLGPQPLPPDVIGAAVVWDVAGTLALGLQLLPATRHVAVVAGPNPLEQQLGRTAIAEVARQAPRAAVIDFTGPVEWSALLSRLAMLPEHTLVLPVGLSADASGRAIDQVHALQIGARVANAPVFTLNRSTFGAGTVGGSRIDFERTGEIAGEQAARLLAGQSVREVGQMRLHPTSKVLDERALLRWQISQARVPEGVEILNRSPSLWRDFRGQFLATAAAFATLLAVLALMVVERRRRRRAERLAQHQLAALARMERAATIGQLSASLAHEVNQPLGAVINYARGAERLLNQQPPPLERVAQALREIGDNGQRAVQVMERVRRLFNGDGRASTTIDMTQLVDETVALVKPEALRRGVELLVELQSPPPALTGDAVQLQQMLLNLLLNALDASEGQPHGQVLVQLGAQDGGLALSVCDNGPGIPASLLPRIFDPFFTTKATGMGMGLVLVRRILESHGGRTRATDRPAGGTAMQVWLPAAEEGADPP